MRLRPFKRISPPAIRPGGLTSLAMDIAVTLLPQPLSPTRPSVLPFATRKETSSTAFTMPSSVKKYVLRFLTSRTSVKLSRPPDIPRELAGMRQRFHRSLRKLRQLQRYAASSSPNPGRLCPDARPRGGLRCCRELHGRSKGSRSGRLGPRDHQGGSRSFAPHQRSEERRVGKEGKSEWSGFDS